MGGAKGSKGQVVGWLAKSNLENSFSVREENNGEESPGIRGVADFVLVFLAAETLEDKEDRREWFLRSAVFRLVPFPLSRLIAL